MNGSERPDAVELFDDLQVRRLLASIFPTRFERVLQRIVTSFYRRSETGLCGWVGDRADDLRCWNSKRRAAAGRHLIAKGRQR